MRREPEPFFRLSPLKHPLINMNLRSLLSFFVIGASVCLASCDDDDDKRGPISDETSFTVSDASLDYLKTESSRSIYVRAASLPVATSDSEWLHVTDFEKNGESANIYVAQVSVDENTGYDDRTGTIKIVAGNESQTVTVKQSYRDGVLVSANSLTLLPEGGSVEVAYQSTGDVKVTAPEWMTEVAGRALTPGVIKFAVAANRTGDARQGEVVIALASDNSVKATVAVSQESVDITAMPSAIAIARDMYVGVNIGNTMEATGDSNPATGETAWGAPKINEAYIQGIKNAGFNAVRIPCAWSQYIVDPATHKINDAWLDRVHEVVKMVVDNGMYAIVNAHWDGGWLEDHIFDGFKQETADKQKAIWTQIATKLGEFDHHLLFAGSNEVGMNEMNSGKKFDATSYQTVTAYAQAFIDAVRATGGSNINRTLIVQTPATNIAEAVKWASYLPVDPSDGHLMVEAHFYDPSDFSIMDKDGAWSTYVKWFWGADYHVEGSVRNCTWGEESVVDDMMGELKNAYVSKGIPVVLGEYGAMRRGIDDPDQQARHEDSRAYYHSYVVKSAKNNGVIPFYWDKTTWSAEWGIFNREDGTVKDQKNLAGIMKGAAEGNYPY